MPELLLLCFLMIPQTVAGFYANSIGKSFWFWFFISFLIPIVSLLLLLYLDKEKSTERKSFKLADHVEPSGNKKATP
jgi:hypothetical protein